MFASSKMSNVAHIKLLVSVHAYTLFHIWTFFAFFGYYHNYMLLKPQKELLRHPGKRKCKYLDKKMNISAGARGTFFNIDFRSKRRTVNAQDEWRRLRQHPIITTRGSDIFPLPPEVSKAKFSRGSADTFTLGEIYCQRWTLTLNLHIRLLEENAEMATGFDVKLTNCCACGV